MSPKPEGELPGIEWPTWPEDFTRDNERWPMELYCAASPAFRYKGRRVELRFVEHEGRLMLVGAEIGPSLHRNTLFAFSEDLKPLRTGDLRLPLLAIIEDLFR